MKGGLFKMATAAGLVGLAVLHADSFGRLVSKMVGTFREAVRLA